MKKKFGVIRLILILFLVLICENVIPQTGILWAKQFGSSGDEYALNHVIDNNGNIYVSGKTSGNFEGNNKGLNDGFITKIDKKGNVLWSGQFGTPGDEDIQWSAIDSKGNIYITGSTTGTLGDKKIGDMDVFVVKFSSEGKKIWTRQFGTDSTDIGKGIYSDKKGNIFITGSTKGKLGNSSYGKTDGFITKLDSNGNLIFSYQFGTEADDYCNSITGDDYESIFVCGSTWGDLGGKNKGMMDAFTGQFTLDGDPVKFNQFGSEGFDIAMEVKADKEKYLYVGGSTSGNLGCQQIGDGDCFLTKLDFSGQIKWTSQFGTAKHDGLRSILLNNKFPENIIVSGLQNLPPAQSFIRVYKKDGTLLLEKNMATACADCDASGKDISIDEDGNICLLGLTASNLFGQLAGKNDFFLIYEKMNF